MAKEILVSQYLTQEMIRAGAELVEEVKKSDLQVVAAFWLYFEEAEEWRLVLASQRLHKDGPLVLYEELSKLLYDGDRDERFGIGLKNTTFISSDAKLVRALALIDDKLGSLEGKRFTRTSFGGEYVEDIYIYFVFESVRPLAKQAWYIGDRPLNGG